MYKEQDIDEEEFTTRFKKFKVKTGNRSMH